MFYLQIDSLSARLSGTIFYGNALLSLPISWKFLNNWKNLSNFWFIGIHHSGLKIPPDRSIRMRVIFVGWFVAVGAFVEHMLSMMSATGLQCPANKYLETYILNSHGFLLHKHEYSVWLAIPIFIISKLATILWNFQDLIIILISIGLASRYNQLNSYVKRIISYEKNEKNCNLVNRIMIWRKIRHAYLHQSKLVRKIDESLGLLVLLSNLNNLYFICLQLFLGIRTDNSELIEDIYYLYSLAWLLLRASFVVLAASEVNLHSTRALLSLNSCTSRNYNIEIKRLIYQLSHQEISLSGMGFFYLYRQKLLEVAAVIVKYELIMLQYDKQS
ncbi:gustatory receptor for sugar taste 64a-like [Leptidea sinapis]|uniref:gustatory receptor for sugar taste 64a-like n=1 Tax=Leptidea sinapis TaxID=189913 RepID=UPI0021C472A3|nr:gustatory receptor for sugar taste 64a-like [Leptidea sinapis]